jgi:hypothetical protein
MSLLLALSFVKCVCVLCVCVCVYIYIYIYVHALGLNMTLAMFLLCRLVSEFITNECSWQENFPDISDLSTHRISSVENQKLRMQDSYKRPEVDVNLF